MGVGMCLYAQLVQTKNKQCKSAIINFFIRTWSIDPYYALWGHDHELLKRQSFTTETSVLLLPCSQPMEQSSSWSGVCSVTELLRGQNWQLLGWLPVFIGLRYIYAFTASHQSKGFPKGLIFQGCCCWWWWWQGATFELHNFCFLPLASCTARYRSHWSIHQLGVFSILKLSPFSKKKKKKKYQYAPTF